MKCPHCLEHYVSAVRQAEVDVPSTPPKHDGFTWYVEADRCPGCGKADLALFATGRHNREYRWRIYPRGAARPLDSVVPDRYAEDFNEACAVLVDSPKASAALSRRCLQALLHREFEIHGRDLRTEIDQLLESQKLPSYIASVVDSIRGFGNFAAHPIPNTETGQIVAVEPQEAEWCLDVLESLFDFCFVQPAKTKAKKEALNVKLAAAKKPPMQEPPDE